MNFIGIGALNLDRLYKVSSIAKGDSEIPIQETVEEPGGSAANTIYALGKLGMVAGFIGSVGNDEEGWAIRRSFNHIGVDTSGICVKPNVRTGFVIGLIDAQGERSLYIAPGANNLLSQKDMDSRYLLQADYVHLSSFVSDEQLEVQKEIVKLLDKDKNKLSFAPGSLYVKKGFEALSPIIKKTHVLFLNEVEAKTLTGKDYEEASRSLIESGCNIVAVTLKGEGCFVTDGSESMQVPAQKTEVIDTTGAGDAFCAGFLYGLAQGGNLKDSGTMGNIVAARCISKIGARRGLPQKKEVEMYLD